MFMFFDSRREDERFWNGQQQAFPEFNMLLISLWLYFLFVITVTRYLNFAISSKDLLTASIQWFCSTVWYKTYTCLAVPAFISVTNKEQQQGQQQKYATTTLLDGAPPYNGETVGVTNNSESYASGSKGLPYWIGHMVDTRQEPYRAYDILKHT